MSKKRKKSKKRASKAKRRPPLCAWDKLTYWAILLLCFAAFVGIIWGTLWLQHNIAFADPEVVAYTENISTLWVIVPLFALMLGMFVPWYTAYEDRKPIWGPKEPPPYVSPKQKKMRKYGVVFVLIVVLICLIPYPWSLFGRTCLRKDGSIVRYNMFNHRTAEYPSDEITDVCIKGALEPVGRYGSSRIGSVYMVLTTNRGKEYIFTNSEFRDDTGRDAWLTAMMKLKAQYPPERVHYKDTDYLDKVIEDRSLTDEEIQLLYQLFDLPS